MKTKKKVKMVKYMTKEQLLQVAEEGDRIGFNRQIEPTALPRVTNEKMPVLLMGFHEHIAGEPAEPHCRCCVTFRVEERPDPQWVIMDMTVERYRSLPVMRVKLAA